MIPVKSANNIIGTLHQTYSGEDGFEDYYLNHTDLTIQIQDEDAFLYKAKNGTLILDHSPETLGM